MCGEDGKRRAELSAQLRKLEPGLAGNLRKADLFKGPFGKERHKRGDHFLTIAGCRCWRLRRGSPATTLRFAGHDDLPWLSFYLM
jgi:hypothetical protein